MAKYNGQETIEVNVKRPKGRFILFIVFLIIAAVAFGYGVSTLFATGAGYREIEVGGADPGCAGDFVFLAYFEGNQASRNTEYRALSSFYADLCRKEAKIYDTDPSDDVKNVAYLNSHPNEEIAIDRTLYGALEKVAAVGSRAIFLAPVAPIYREVFSCQYDFEAELADPAKDEEIAQAVASAMAFAADPEAVSLDLLGEGKVILRVSDAYLAFAEENGTGFVDFFALKNAFILDDLADALNAAGYTRGIISSKDGASRSLSSMGEPCRAAVLDRVGAAAGTVGYAEYEKPLAVVCFHDFPFGETDGEPFGYFYESGETVHPYLDLSTGRPSAAVPALVAASENCGCASLAMRLYPVYTAEVLELSALSDLAESGVSSVLVLGKTVRSFGDLLSVVDLVTGYTLNP